MGFLLKLLGVLLIVEGVPWFLSPQGMRRWLRQVLEIDDRLLRAAGFALMFLGLALVFFASR